MPRLLQLDGLVEHGQAVLVHVLMVVVFVDLEPERRKLGQHDSGDAGVDEQLEARSRGRTPEQLAEFVAHALHGDDRDAIGERAHGCGGRLGDRETELRGEPGGSHHPQRIVSEGCFGRSGCGQTSGDEVFHSTRGIDEHLFWQAHGHRVDREVPPHEVALEGVAELDDGFACLTVVGIGAIGRDLDGVAFDACADGAESATDVPVRVRDRLHESEDLVGQRIGREVQVGQLPPEEGIAHRTADEGELEAGRVERGGEA